MDWFCELGWIFMDLKALGDPLQGGSGTMASGPGGFSSGSEHPSSKAPALPSLGSNPIYWPCWRTWQKC